jgi:4-hydroxybenzoyl-CoA reductase subunit beta
MMLGEFEALQPASVEEASALLRKHKDAAVLKAGGTALIPEMKCGLKAPEYVITLSSVEGLDDIREEAGGLRIGATASLHKVKTHSVVLDKYPALSSAIESVSAPSMHHQSTIGGNICQNTRCQFYNQSELWKSGLDPCFKTLAASQAMQRALSQAEHRPCDNMGGERCHAAPGANKCNSVYQGDLAALLMCMEAKLRIVSPRKERVAELGALFTGRGHDPLRLKPNELVAEIIIPPPDGRKFGYAKLRERGSLDYPILGVAAMLELKGTMCQRSLFVVTAMGPKPLVIEEPFLRSRDVDDGFIEDAAHHVRKKVHPIANLSSTPAYRKEMTTVMVERVVKEVLG